MKLIVHIGAGKTGTTSIQNTLLKNRTQLNRQGIKYLGLIFEEAYEIRYPWQDKYKNYHESMKLPNIQAELVEVLQHSLNIADIQNIHTLIWSNESILDNPHVVLSSLEVLRDFSLDLDIELVMYVRDYIEWAWSAYIQWGIKHKTNEGVVEDFSTFSKRVKPLFYEKLMQITQRYDIPVVLRNMDAINDVVSDFLSHYNISLEYIPNKKDNKTPQYEELFLRSIFNSKFSRQVLPYEYDTIIAKEAHLGNTVEEYLYKLLPTQEELKELSSIVESDREAINTLLQEQGQKELGCKPKIDKTLEINSSILIKALTEIIMSQSIKLNRLEKELEMIKRKI